MSERGHQILSNFEHTLLSDIEGTKIESVLGPLRKRKDTYRTSLTSFSCESVGGNPDKADKVGLLIAMAGAGLALHDDIIDRSNIKKFTRTYLGLHDSDITLIIGDLLLFKTLSIIREIFIDMTCSDKVIEITTTFEQFLFDMCEAELMEISFRKNINADINHYHKALWKLGCDVEVCTTIGAIVGDGSVKEVTTLSEYGKRMGYIVRLADDVKDVLNLEGNLIHRLTYESIPLPILFAAKKNKRYYNEIDMILKKPKITFSDAKYLIQICFEAEAFAYVENIAQRYALEGKQHLQILKDSSARDVLSSLIQEIYYTQSHIDLNF